MKKPMNVVEVENEGLLSLMGENVMLFCCNYIYAGKLTGVNETCVELSDAKLVYETGPFSTKGYQDAQSLPTDRWYVQTQSIESFGPGK